MTTHKPDSMTNSVLVNAALVKREDNIIIPSKSLVNFDGDDLLLMYIKSKKMLQIVAIQGLEDHNIINLTMFSATGDLLKFSVVMSQSIFTPEGFELLWTSGVCTPDEDARKRLGIPEDLKDGCVWEGVLKVPSSVTPETLRASIEQFDEETVLARVDIKTIERISHDD